VAPEHTTDPIAAAGGVTVRTGQDGAPEVLLVHRPAHDDWSLPKGHLDADEDAATAAAREVAEETGVTVRVVAELSPTEHATPAGPKRVRWFLTEARAGDPGTRAPDDEVDRARWVGLTEARSLLTYASDAGVLEEALRWRSAHRAAPPRIGPARGTTHAEVGPGTIGRRVTLRHLTDDPLRGPVPTDVVGRLIGADDEALVVVDRAGTLKVVATATLVASRIVPEHPRLAPEPTVGTREDPLVRAAARVLLLDRHDRALLVAHLPGGRAARVWTAPGGGVDPGEDHADAARRELLEEIGITPELGPWVWSRRATFPFHGVWIEQTERWFLARVDDVDPAGVPLDDVGTEGVRWWDRDELAATEERIAPAAFAPHLVRLIDDGPPDAPIDVGP